MSYRVRIEKYIGPEAMQRFLSKSKDYGEEHQHLGVKGQFSDIWRKVGKLKRALWEDIPMEHEDPIEMLQDLIGHCYLTIDLLNEEHRKLQQETDVF
jgi:muconolactone delta-isomerase